MLDSASNVTTGGFVSTFDGRCLGDQIVPEQQSSLISSSNETPPYDLAFGGFQLSPMSQGVVSPLSGRSPENRSDDAVSCFQLTERFIEERPTTKSSNTSHGPRNGRKLIDSAQNVYRKVKREQNRIAQQKFRMRKEARLNELNDMLTLQAEENKKLRHYNQWLHMYIGILESQILQMQGQSFTFTPSNHGIFSENDRANRTTQG